MTFPQIAHERSRQTSSAPPCGFEAAGSEDIPLRAGDLVSTADEFDNPFKIHVVGYGGGLCEASSLLERRYAWRGYSISPLALPSSHRITLAASVGDATVATISAGLDGAEGMNVASLYPDEVQIMRDEGRMLCEFTKLAVHEDVRSRAVLAGIFHVANMYVSNLHGCSDVLIEVNPRHVRFYERMLGFQAVGDERLDPEVNAPAVLLRLELAHSARQIACWGGRSKSCERARSFYPYFFGAGEASEIESRLRRQARGRSLVH